MAGIRLHGGKGKREEGLCTGEGRNREVKLKRWWNCLKGQKKTKWKVSHRIWAFLIRSTPVSHFQPHFGC